MNAGAMPRFTSGVWSQTSESPCTGQLRTDGSGSCLPILISDAKTMPTPPPSAGPLRRAIIGLESPVIAVNSLAPFEIEARITKFTHTRIM